MQIWRRQGDEGPFACRRSVHDLGREVATGGALSGSRPSPQPGSPPASGLPPAARALLSPLLRPLPPSSFPPTSPSSHLPPRALSLLLLRSPQSLARVVDVLPSVSPQPRIASSPSLHRPALPSLQCVVRIGLTRSSVLDRLDFLPRLHHDAARRWWLRPPRVGVR